jgi:ATP-binding cassette, subfamily B, bacterial MsbA
VNTFRRVYDLLSPYRGRVLLALGLAALACLLNLPTPVLIQGLVDHVVAGGALSSVPLYALALLAAFALQAATALATTLLMGRVGLEVVRGLRHNLYARLQRLSLSYYDRTPAGSIISRLMDDVSAVQGLVTSQTLSILTDLGTALVISGWLLARSPRLFLVVLGFVPVYVVVFRFFTRRIRAGSAAVRERLDGVFGHLKEKIDGILVVKAHAREEAEVAQFAAQIGAAHGPRVQVGRMGAAFSSLTLAISGVGASVVFAAGAFEALRGRMSAGEVVSATALAALLFGPVARLADLASVFEQVGTSIARLGEILDQQADLPEPAEPVDLGRAKGLVEFDSITFGYQPGQRAVSDVTLRVEPGMRVALVGPTGCGKSTLMNLLLRFYDPQSGEVRLDGVPLRRLRLAELRRQVGVVPQDAVVFRQSLADNIRYGTPGADMARVESAARAAQVHEFACRLPEGYATVVGEGGYKLSQGERQRVAIARAFCKDPALIVLDEATSSLDTAGEAQVQRALEQLLKGRTAFVIAHRLSTVLSADLIVVLDAGRVVQVGTHHQLLAQPGGLYRRLCARQFCGLALFPDPSPPPLRAPVPACGVGPLPLPAPAA